MISLVWLVSLALVCWCEWANAARDERSPLGTYTKTHSWKTNAWEWKQKNTSPCTETQRSSHTVLLLHTRIHTHTPQKKRKIAHKHKFIKSYIVLAGLKSQIHQLVEAHAQTRRCTVRACLDVCKNNKANLVKGVGGEAARQKDINSLSEFNNRGGEGVGGGEGTGWWW